jgi:non-heme chloroperoxidase
VQRGSLRAVWDAALFDLPNAASVRRVPMLVLGAASDRMIAPELVALCARTLGAPCEIVPAMGHAMMLDRGWQGVADRLARFLLQSRS